MDLPINLVLYLAVGISMVMIIGLILNNQTDQAVNFFTGVMP